MHGFGKVLIVISLLFSQTFLWADDAQMLMAYAELTKANAEYRRVFIEAHYKAAEAELRRAEAAHEFVKARMLGEKLDHMQRELATLRNDEFKLEMYAVNLSLKSNLIRPLRRGEIDKGVWVGIDHFLDHEIPANVLKDVMFSKVPALPADNFVGRKSKEFKGGRLGHFLKFLKENEISVEAYSDAHAVLLDMIVTLERHAEMKIKEVKAQTDAILNKKIGVTTN